MGRGKTLVLVAALLSAAVWLPPGSMAADLRGHSSTVFEWHDTPDEETAFPLYEYLRLEARDLGAEGLDFVGYGRLGYDPADEADADSRLYYAYLDKEDILLQNLDMKLGRMFVVTAAGSALLDGVDATYTLPDWFAFKLFGGGDATFYEEYEWGDFLWGAEIEPQLAENLVLALSYAQTWEDGDLTRELFGADAEYGWEESLVVFGEWQFNYLSNATSFFQLGGTWHQKRAWSLTAHYLYSLPVFDSTSIYSVFAVEEYEELHGRFVYRIAEVRGLRTYLAYTHEFYDEFDDADVFEVGVEQIRTGRFTGYFAGTWRDDEDGQDLYGFKAYGNYRFHANFDAGLGAHVDVLERRAESSDETTASRLWAVATAYITRDIDIEAKVERGESDLYDHYYRGRVRLNVRF